MVPRQRPFCSPGHSVPPQASSPRKRWVLFFTGIPVILAVLNFPELFGQLQENDVVLESKALQCVNAPETSLVDGCAPRGFQP